MRAYTHKTLAQTYKIKFTNVYNSDKKDACFSCVYVYMQVISYVDVRELFSANGRHFSVKGSSGTSGGTFENA